MGNHWLNECDVEKDLGVLISRDFKFSKQCTEARNNANKVLWFINRNVAYKSKELVKKLYISFVRPHLEYCIQACRSLLKKDIKLLESVQRRATRMIPGFKRFDYGTRLKLLNMFSIERRHSRGDMIEIFKIIKGYDKLNFADFFQFVNNREDNSRGANHYNTRGHSLKLKTAKSRLDIRKHFFSVRSVALWKKLSEGTVTSSTLNEFKRRLDIDMTNLGIEWGKGWTRMGPRGSFPLCLRCLI